LLLLCSLLLLLLRLQPQMAAVRNRLALDVALGHPALSTDPRILCAAAQACKAWQQAVQQCGACNTVVKLNTKLPLQQICSFVRWLRKHAGLVKSFTAKAAEQAPHGMDKLQWQHHIDAAQLLLQQAMELAVGKPAAAFSAAAAAAAAPAAASQGAVLQHTQQQQSAMRLASFSSNLPCCPSMLPALTARHLTQLDLTLLQNCSIDAGPQLAAALHQLSILQQLQLDAWRAPRQSLSSCFAGIAQLTRLTSLVLSMRLDGKEESLQQALAQPLPLRNLQLLHMCDWNHLDLSALTQLETLVTRELPERTVLPLQLQHLHVTDWLAGASLAAVVPLQQLQTLRLKVDFEEQQPLLRLAQLPALRHLEIEYWQVRCVAGTAAAWPQLPQLRALDIWWDEAMEEFPVEQQLSFILDKALACTGLTKLAFTSQNGSYVSDKVAVCARLAKLTRLRDLCMYGNTALVPGDAQALTALTGLTRLVLGDVHGVDEEHIVALAGCMPRLQHLDVTGLRLSSTACTAAIGRLTQLTELVLSNNEDITEQSLLQLTGLLQLQQLEVGGCGVADDAVERFWAEVRLHR
jgi:hypothetical protein